MQTYFHVSWRKDVLDVSTATFKRFVRLSVVCKRHVVEYVIADAVLSSQSCRYRCTLMNAYNADMISAESASDKLCQPLHNKRLGLYFVSFVRNEAACVLF